MNIFQYGLGINILLAEGDKKIAVSPISKRNQFDLEN
jgi:hypothetical protein